MTTILLVENDEMNKDMLSRRLMKKGYDVIFAVNGQEAIDMAKSKAPDVILMDMGLPIKSGLEATKEIKENADTVNIPIIALTANAMAEHRKEALDGGFDEFETKPVRLPSLLEKINKYT